MIAALFAAVVPNLAVRGVAMLADQELIALLYRADWTRLCLSGEVSGFDDPSQFIRMIVEHGPGTQPPFEPPPPFPFGADPRPRVVNLLLGPGKRYREDGTDGQFSQGCDGERTWHWLPHPPAVEMRLYGKPEPPFPALLCPSWLLVSYDLEIEGRVQACGREGIRVVATQRRGGMRARQLRSFGPLASRLPGGRFDHADVVVDSGLGILLRCERRNEGQAPVLTEFRSLTVDPDFDPARFTAPPGSIIGEGYGHSFNGIGWQAAKTAAGLAAGGLGVALKYSPFSRLRVPDPPGPRDDDAEAALEQGDPPPGDARDDTPVSDEVLHLLYRGAPVVPELTATLHEWSDPRALLAAVPRSAREAGFGGVGYLIDAIDEISTRQAGEQSVRHQVSRVRIGGWDTYRVDRAGQDDEWVTLASDGQRRWQVYADRVVVGPSAPLPAELADLIDVSWLLWCRLSGGSEVMADGRRAYRICVAGSWSASPLMTFSLPAVAMLDAQTGRLFRLTCYGDGKPVQRYELRDITEAGTGDFGFEVPAGLTVVDEPPAEDRPPRVGPLDGVPQAVADAVKRQVDDRITAVRGFFDSLMRPRPPRR